MTQITRKMLTTRRRYIRRCRKSMKSCRPYRSILPSATDASEISNLSTPSNATMRRRTLRKHPRLEDEPRAKINTVDLVRDARRSITEEGGEENACRQRRLHSDPRVVRRKERVSRTPGGREIDVGSDWGARVRRAASGNRRRMHIYCSCTAYPFGPRGERRGSEIELPSRGPMRTGGGQPWQACAASAGPVCRLRLCNCIRSDGLRPS